MSQSQSQLGTRIYTRTAKQAQHTTRYKVNVTGLARHITEQAHGQQTNSISNRNGGEEHSEPQRARFLTVTITSVRTRQTQRRAHNIRRVHCHRATAVLSSGTTLRRRHYKYEQQGGPSSRAPYH